MFLANVVINRTADINMKTRVRLLISETDVWTIDFDVITNVSKFLFLLLLVVSY